MVVPEPYEYELFGVKTCSCCRRRLPRNADFFTTDKTADGFKGTCRECVSRRARERYAGRKAVAG
jgi:hypothetical protein